MTKPVFITLHRVEGGESNVRPEDIKSFGISPDGHNIVERHGYELATRVLESPDEIRQLIRSGYAERDQEAHA